MRLILAACLIAAPAMGQAISAPRVSAYRGGESIAFDWAFVRECAGQPDPDLGVDDPDGPELRAKMQRAGIVLARRSECRVALQAAHAGWLAAKRGEPDVMPSKP